MWRSTLLTALVVLATVAVPTAQTPSAVDVEADRLFHRVMSPYCPGRVLATCGSSAADVLRQEVRRDLAAGQPADEVEAELYRRFGDAIRGEPKAAGVGLLAWVLPAAMLVVTAGWLITWLRRARRPRTASPEIASVVSPELIGRLNDELLDLN